MNLIDKLLDSFQECIKLSAAVAAAAAALKLPNT